MMMMEQNYTYQTPFPPLPDLNTTTPPTPKRCRGASEELSRRVRANLHVLSIPDIATISDTDASSTNQFSCGGLQLQPQGQMKNISSMFLKGAMRHNNNNNKAHQSQLMNQSSLSLSLSKKTNLMTANSRRPFDHLRSPVIRQVLAAPPADLQKKKKKTITPRQVKSPDSTTSLLSLRMAAMRAKVGGGGGQEPQQDQDQQLLFFGVTAADKKSFHAPNRSRSSPYSLPSRNTNLVRNRSFNALCA